MQRTIDFSKVNYNVTYSLNIIGIKQCCLEFPSCGWVINTPRQWSKLASSANLDFDCLFTYLVTFWAAANWIVQSKCSCYQSSKINQKLHNQLCQTVNGIFSMMDRIKLGRKELTPLFFWHFLLTWLLPYNKRSHQKHVSSVVGFLFIKISRKY